MTAGTELQTHVRQMPWQRLGTAVNGAMTAQEALELGGLDWTVDKERMVIARELPSETEGGDPKIEYVDYKPPRFSLTRNTDKRSLAIVSSVYNPFQNHEAFNFMDTLVDDGSAKYTEVGSYRGGAVVFAAMHVPMDLLVAGEDRHEMYLLLRTSHDGSGRIGIYVTPVRIGCTNVINLAMRQAPFRWGITHTANVAGKIQEARESLQLTFNYADEFKLRAESLIDVKITDDDIVKLLEGVVPIRAKRDEEIEAIITNHRESANIANYRHTGWGFLNAYTEYQEHLRETRSASSAFSKTLDGPQSKARTTLADRLLAMN